MKSLNEMGREFNRHSGANPTLPDVVYRAMEEMSELLAEVEADNLGRAADEMADVILTIAGGAALVGIRLDVAIAAKHAINLSRKWGPHPTIPGAVQHIKEPESEPKA